MLFYTRGLPAKHVKRKQSKLTEACVSFAGNIRYHIIYNIISNRLMMEGEERRGVVAACFCSVLAVEFCMVYLSVCLFPATLPTCYHKCMRGELIKLYYQL